jgi:protein-S-isoprenylcysteine O-methyltransferase Ste14
MKWLEARIPPPLVALLVAIGMWALAPTLPVPGETTTERFVAALACVLLGAVTSLAGVVAFRRSRTTVNPLRPETASSLVNGGVYRLTRNPMYVGFLFVLLGWAVWLWAPWPWLGLPLFMLFLTRFQIVPEERAMEKLFGNAYREYRNQVRRWL